MRLFSFLRPDDLHNEISEELRFHIEMKAGELMGRGLSPAEARRIAEKSFGSTTRVAEAGHDVRAAKRMEAIAGDVRFALRLLKKQPVKTAVLIATLALGVGVNTAVFSVVHSLLLQPLAYPKSDQLVVLHQANHGASSGVSYPHFRDWRQSSRSFRDMAVYGSAAATLTGQGEPVVLSGATVSNSIFRVLGVQPLRGRLFREEEDTWGSGAKSASPVLISDRLWRSRFNAREDSVGRLIKLDGREYNVIGIMPSQLGYPVQKDPVDYWTTVAVDGDPALYGGTILTSRGYPRYDGVIARLKPGVNVAQARGEMDKLAAALAKEYPHATSAEGVVVVSALQEVLGSESRTMVLLLYAAVFCVLLVACVNVATILVVDTMARRREFYLRSALGAPGSTLVRQMLVESVVLALAGCLASSVVAAVALHVLVTFAPPDTPRLQEIHADGSVLLYAAAVSFLAGLLLGCLPALAARGNDLAGPLKEGSYAVTRKASVLGSGRILIAGQIALSMVLTCSAMMLVMSLAAMLQTARGFNPHNVLTASISLPVSGYGQASPRVATFYNSLLQDVRTLPGVKAAALAEVLPLSGRSNSTTVEVVGVQQPGRTGVDLRFVDAQYFSTLQIALQGGRLFNEQDAAGRPPCAIVNAAFVRRFLQGRDPFSSDLRLGWGGGAAKRIVGVVSDVRPTATSAATSPEVYVPFAQFPLNDMSVLIRSTGDPGMVTTSLRAAVRRLDRTVPLDRVRSLDDYLVLSSASPRFLMLLLVAFASMTTLLSAVGVYGVLSEAAAARTQEFGIRLALGASRTRIAGLVLRQGLMVAAAGLIFGSFLTLGSTRFLQRWLYDANSAQAGPYVMSAALLFVVVLAACSVPSRRAASIDPSISLRMS